MTSSIRRVPLGVAVLVSTCTMATAQVAVNPQALNFVYQVGGANPAAQNLYISGSVPTQFGVTTSGAPWVTVSPASGITPNTLIVTVRPPADAAPGVLSGSIVIGPAASTDALRLVVPVTLQIVAPPQGNLVVSPSSVVSDYRVGGPAPPAQPVSITSTGGPAAFNLSSHTNSGGSWLSANASSYTTPAITYISVTPVSTLVPGIHTGTVAVIPAYAGGVTRYINVTVRVSTTGAIAVAPNYLTFEYQTGGTVPEWQYLRVNHSVGTPIPFTVSVSTPTGPWLAVTPTSGTTPSTLAVQVFPTMMPVQTHYGTITIQPAGGGAATQIPVSLTVSSTPQLRTSPSSVVLEAQAGAPAPPTQYIQVSSTGNPLTFTPSVVGPSWVTIPGSAQVTPASIPVTARPPASTAPGTYVATVTMTPTSGGSNPVSIPVTIDVISPNSVTLSPRSVSFVYSRGGAFPPTQAVSVTSTGEPLRFQAAGSSSWVTVSTTGPDTPSTIHIGAVPTSLAPGVYRDRVNVTSDGAINSPQTIDVTLTVTADPIFSAAPFGFMFSHQIGGPPPSNQLAVITNTMPNEEFTISVETDNGGNWLFAAGGGVAPAALAAAVSPNVVTSPGIYTGTVIVRPKSSTMPELRVPVVFNVTLGPALRTSTNMIAFQYQQSTPAPSPQTISVSSTAGPLGFYTSVRTADGGSWLTVTPDFATSPTTINVAANPAGLAPGQYVGAVVLTGATQEAVFHYIPVMLTVSTQPIPTVPAQSALFAATTGGPKPAAQVVRVLSEGVSISATAQSSGWLTAEPATATGPVNLSVQAVVDGYAPGYYLGLITVQIPGYGGTQQYVPAALAVMQ